MILANLGISADDRWIRSDAYNRLDPSEKVAVSYFLGMVQAELMATSVLGYTHLVHVDALMRAAGLSLLGQRPDFVALNVGPRGSAIFGATVEAKGRTNGFDAVALDKAKRQSRVVPMIAGVLAQETIASEAFFSDAGQWSSVLEDPDWQGVEINLGIETYLREYYRVVIEAGRQTSTWSLNQGFYQFELPGLPLSVGVPASLVVAYDQSAVLPAEEREAARPILEACWDLTDNSPVTPTDHVDLQFTAATDPAEFATLFARETHEG